MTDPVSHWVETSRATMAVMERDLKHHHAAVEAAMAKIRNHTKVIEALEGQLEIIGNALASAEAAIARAEDAEDAEEKATLEPAIEEQVVEQDVPKAPRPPRVTPPRPPGAFKPRPKAPPLRAVGTS